METVNRGKRTRGRCIVAAIALVMGCWIAAPAPCFGAEPAAESASPASFKISGYGLFGNRQLRRLVNTLEIGRARPEFFEPAFVEDAALIMAARVRRDGFLDPQILIELDLPNGDRVQLDSSELIENPLPPGMRIRRAHFRIREGVRYYFQRLEFDGLESVPRRQALSYFYEIDPLIRSKANRVYTPDRLRRGMTSLQEVLDRRGFRDAVVEPGIIVTNANTGGMAVLLKVREGPRYVVRTVREEVYKGFDTNAAPADINVLFPLQPYSRAYEENLELRLKTNQFTRGFPDVSVDITERERIPQDQFVEVDLLATVRTGPQVRIAGVDFRGEERTRESVMRRRVRVERGDLLDPLRVERGRQRLARLGIFDSVNTSTEEVDEQRRQVVYTVDEGRWLNVNLLFGYGSYELLRGGAELELFNIWGRAHSARLTGVQSFKSTSGDFLYSIPEVLGRDLNIFFQASGLRREEVSFTREEFGGGVGVSRHFAPISSDISLRYNYQVLNAANIFPAVATEGLTNPAVGAVILDFKHDRRNNPLLPRSGYKIFASFETASSTIGGDANYQRVDVSPSFHLPLGRGSFLAAGISHGVAASFGAVSENLPFNRRYFPGGENSIRGYPEGEASPRNAQGEFVGAETYTLATVEFEQALTRSWSIVLFSDSLGVARRLEGYPWDVSLFSVGGGLRWRTIVGPVRAEYGYNINPREGDPIGAFHISLGFPF
jgi:outer membrane protein insertion porin family